MRPKPHFRHDLRDQKGWLYVPLCCTGLAPVAGLLKTQELPRRVRPNDAERFGAASASVPAVKFVKPLDNGKCV